MMPYRAGVLICSFERNPLEVSNKDSVSLRSLLYVLSQYCLLEFLVDFLITEDAKHFRFLDLGGAHAVETFFKQLVSCKLKLQFRKSSAVISDFNNTKRAH